MCAAPPASCPRPLWFRLSPALLPGKDIAADHCSIEVVRAAGGSGDICVGGNDDRGGAGCCTVSVEAFEKRNPNTVMLALQLQANIANSDVHA